MAERSKFMRLSNVDDKTKKIVFGFIRNSQNYFPQNNSYYNIPDLVIQICLLYYLMNDKFDKKCIGESMKLNEKEQTITMENETSNSAFLTNIIDHGIHHWRFKIKQCAKLRGSENNWGGEWYTTLGIWKVKSDDNEEKLPINTYFSEKYKGSRSYGFAYNIGELLDIDGGLPKDSGNSTDDKFKYGIKCTTNDIIDMICDLEKYELRFNINTKKYGKAFDIEKCKYRAVINLYTQSDSITLIQ